MSDTELDFDFDEAWYLQNYPDVAKGVREGNCSSGLDHYLRHGRSEGRKPSAGFDAEWYVRAYPPVLKETGSATPEALGRHYRERGCHRGYLPHPKAMRPRNAAALRSEFGGLWIDHANAQDLIAGRQQLGLIDSDEARLLATFVEQGFVILPQAVPAELIDRAEQDVDLAYGGGMPALRFECHTLSPDHITWHPELRDYAAKALDFHWHSATVRDAIFCPAIVRFLQLIFERPVLASQSLVFYRGSGQDIHQDSAYVPYSLPLQFAASWIALENVTEGAGELEYFVESHRKLPDFVYGNAYKSVSEAGRSGSGHNVLTDEVRQHLDAIQHAARTQGLRKERFFARRGDVLIWHADLAHGGSPISSKNTRKSLVTHYCPSEVAPLYFENGETEIRQHDAINFFSSGLYNN